MTTPLFKLLRNSCSVTGKLLLVQGRTLEFCVERHVTNLLSSMSMSSSSRYHSTVPPGRRDNTGSSTSSTTKRPREGDISLPPPPPHKRQLMQQLEEGVRRVTLSVIADTQDQYSPTSDADRQLYRLTRPAPFSHHQQQQNQTGQGQQWQEEAPVLRLNFGTHQTQNISNKQRKRAAFKASVLRKAHPNAKDKKLQETQTRAPQLQRSSKKSHRKHRHKTKNSTMTSNYQKVPPPSTPNVTTQQPPLNPNFVHQWPQQSQSAPVFTDPPLELLTKKTNPLTLLPQQRVPDFNHQPTRQRFQTPRPNPNFINYPQPPAFIPRPPFRPFYTGYGVGMPLIPQLQNYGQNPTAFRQPPPAFPFQRQDDRMCDMFYWRNHQFTPGAPFNARHLLMAQPGARAYSMQHLSTNTRQWERINMPSYRRDKSIYYGEGDGVRFTVMCYNVLSPTLQQKHQNLYDRCDPRALDWHHRLACFYKEIEFCNPDIVCLQEVDDGFLDDYKNFFRAAGYQGVFKKRTGDDKCDGCAMFFRDIKFQLVDSIAVEYRQKPVSLLNRDNIALLVKLATKNDKPCRFVVGTTHLLFNPKRNDVRIGQAKLLLAELDRLACHGLDANGNAKYYPTIINGDFNVDPFSHVSQFFRQGSLSTNALGFQEQLKSIPTRLGITDQCQHYKLIHQRLLLRQIQGNVESHSNESICHVHLSGSPAVVLLKSELDPEIETIDISVEREIANVDSTSEHPNQSILSEIATRGPICTFGTGELSHAFDFQDVYGGEGEREDGENFVTTKQRNKWVRVDYIYYSSRANVESQRGEESNLLLLQRLRLPTRSQCYQFGGGIPCVGVSSDHLLLVAEFLLTPGQMPE